MEAILSLPMVLLHRDFGVCDFMVDGASCHLTGIIDWSEGEICPFGHNFHGLQALTGTLHLKMGGGDMKITSFCRTAFGAHSRTRWETYLQRP